jgi:anti-sigma factor RsiW
MNQENPALADTSPLDEELVSYLDGELSPEAAQQVERRLAEDAGYRARLAQLQRAWDLLDSLQRTEADDEFVHSTVAMVAVQASEDAKSQAMRTVQRRSLAWLAIGALVLLSTTLAFGLIQRRLGRSNRQLLRDLPVIERVDEYRNIDSLEFLKSLERENLFAAEVDDA